MQGGQLVPGLVIKVDKKLYRVESAVKVTVSKKAPFMKVALKEIEGDKTLEKNFRLNQSIEDVALKDRALEYLYVEGKDYLFLDVDELEQVLVPSKIVGSKADYLKAGVVVRGALYGEEVFSLELPQFLELMVMDVEERGGDEETNNAQGNVQATLETGASLEVPNFVEVGDIVKVDTQTQEFIQRV